MWLAASRAAPLAPSSMLWTTAPPSRRQRRAAGPPARPLHWHSAHIHFFLCVVLRGHKEQALGQRPPGAPLLRVRRVLGPGHDLLVPCQPEPFHCGCLSSCDVGTRAVQHGHWLLLFPRGHWSAQHCAPRPGLRALYHLCVPYFSLWRCKLGLHGYTLFTRKSELWN